jgi:hypothetical protein
MQYIYCSLGISLIVPQFCQDTLFLQLTLFLLSRAMHKLLMYFSFFKTMRNDHFLSGKHLK